MRAVHRGTWLDINSESLLKMAAGDSLFIDLIDDNGNTLRRITIRNTEIVEIRTDNAQCSESHSMLVHPFHGVLHLPTDR